MALGLQGGLSTPNASEASQFVVKDFNFAADKKTTANLSSQDGITFTRSGAAYYNNSLGNLVAASSGEPVYEYSQAGASLGMRIEKGTTNRVEVTDLTDSGEPGDNWAVQGGGLAIDFDGTTTGPDNVADSAAKIVGYSGASASYHVTYLANALTPHTGGAHRNNWSGSVYAKKGNVEFLGMILATGNKVGAVFNLDDGTVAGASNEYFSNCTASIEDVGGGWYRCKCENTTGIDTNYGAFGFTLSKDKDLIWNASTGAWASRSGDRQDDGSSNYLYLFGPQYEDSTFCTSYMHNAGQAGSGVVRNPDVCSITDISSFYNPTQGAFAVEGSRTIAGSSALPTILEVNDNSTSETMGFNASATEEQFAINGAGGSATLDAGDDIAKNTAFKVAGAYKAGNYGACLNGGTVNTNTLAAVPTVDQLHFGASENPSRELNGFISRVRYWRRRVSDAFLKKIST